MRVTGEVTHFYKDRGFGFLRAADGTTVFCHMSAFGGQYLAEGQKVEFDLVDDCWRSRAENVALLADTGQLTGKVTFVNDQQTYAIIVAAGKRYFAPSENLIDPVAEGDTVTFRSRQHPRGLRAVDVELLSPAE